MKYGNRSQTKGQQAPISRCCTDSRHASRSVPLHTASTRRNLTSSGTTQASKSAITTVNAILNGVERRFSRSQPSAPVIAAGCGRGAIVSRRTNAISATASSPSDIVIGAAPSSFHQGDAVIVNIHEQRGREADDRSEEH